MLRHSHIQVVVRLSFSNSICAFLWTLVIEIRALCESTGSEATPLLVYCAEHAVKEECLALETCTCFGSANLCVSKWLGSGCWGVFGSSESCFFLPGLGGKMISPSFFFFLFVNGLHLWTLGREEDVYILSEHRIASQSRLSLGLRCWQALSFWVKWLICSLNRLTWA